jgi:hypothetical protein
MKTALVKITDSSGTTDMGRMPKLDALLLSKPATTAILYTVGGSALTAVPFGAIVGALIGLGFGNAAKGAIIGASGGLALSGAAGATAGIKRSRLIKKYPHLKSIEILEDSTSTPPTGPQTNDAGLYLPKAFEGKNPWDLSKAYSGPFANNVAANLVANAIAQGVGAVI